MRTYPRVAQRFFFFQVQPYNRKYRSIGHCVWSMSLNILTELSVNSFNEKHNRAPASDVTITKKMGVAD